MSENYPFQTHYETYLKISELSTSTQKNYSQTMTNLFNFLMEFNTGFANNPSVNNLFDRDISAYLTSLQVSQNITNGTYNKLLSQINHYFKFAFSHQLTTNLPTINLHGMEKNSVTSQSTKWLYSLPEILSDSQIHVYTKMVLLLTSRGYSVQEFLQPHFYQLYEKIPLTENYHQQFNTEYLKFIEPLRIMQQSKDIFLKQRINLENPRLTNAGLHKYLTSDESYLGLDLSPKKLYQSYILYSLNLLRDRSDSELLSLLRLEPASLIYYKNLNLTLS